MDTRSPTNLFLVGMAFSEYKTYRRVDTGILAEKSRDVNATEENHTFSQEGQRYFDVRRFHEFVLVRENIAHGSHICGVQSGGLW